MGDAKFRGSSLCDTTVVVGLVRLVMDQRSSAYGQTMTPNTLTAEERSEFYEVGSHHATSPKCIRTSVLRNTLRVYCASPRIAVCSKLSDPLEAKPSRHDRLGTKNALSHDLFRVSQAGSDNFLHLISRWLLSNDCSLLDRDRRA